MDRSPIETCSPVEAITSNSRGWGSGLSSFARLSRRLVSPAMAEGTTASWWPCLAKRAMRRATSRLRSGLPIEVPPYFWTINATGFRGRRFGEKPLFYLGPPPETNEDVPAPPQTRARRARLRPRGDPVRMVRRRARGGARGRGRFREPRDARHGPPRAAHRALHRRPLRARRARAPRRHGLAPGVHAIRARA